MTLLTAGEDACFVRPHRTRARDRMLAFLWPHELDRALAHGASPDSSVALSLRAHRLIGPGMRRALARELRRLPREAVQRRHRLDARLPICRREVVQATDILREAADRLIGDGPVEAVGVARLRVLLRDGCGPLFDRKRAHELEAALECALEALDCRVAV